ncbi:uncharacterized protein V1513DRAFT_266166 [Lipomyces chichibuensis]|uniref:uncharacterized protein n=1 Tax=Lipomyces chichibuensis TaxID=1546026 RepID=UPI003342EEA9
MSRWSNRNSEIEDRQSKALVDASIKQRVKFFVCTSLDRGGQRSVKNATDFSLHHVELYLLERTKNHEIDWTILRPTSFFENFVPGFVGRIFATSLKISLKRKSLQLLLSAILVSLQLKQSCNRRNLMGKVYH